MKLLKFLVIYVHWNKSPYCRTKSAFYYTWLPVIDPALHDEKNNFMRAAKTQKDISQRLRSIIKTLFFHIFWSRTPTMLKFITKQAKSSPKQSTANKIEYWNCQHLSNIWRVIKRFLTNYAIYACHFQDTISQTDFI